MVNPTYCDSSEGKGWSMKQGQEVDYDPSVALVVSVAL